MNYNFRQKQTSNEKKSYEMKIIIYLFKSSYLFLIFVPNITHNYHSEYLKHKKYSEMSTYEQLNQHLHKKNEFLLTIYVCRKRNVSTIPMSF